MRWKVKIVTFCLIGYRDGINYSCTPKRCQKASEWMKKVTYRYGPYTGCFIKYIHSEIVDNSSGWNPRSIFDLVRSQRSNFRQSASFQLNKPVSKNYRSERQTTFTSVLPTRLTLTQMMCWYGILIQYLWRTYSIPEENNVTLAGKSHEGKLGQWRWLTSDSVYQR